MRLLFRKSLRVNLLVWVCSILHLPAIACGPGLFEDDARFCLFRPTTISYPQLDAMQYSQRLFHGFDPKALDTENDDNCKEWLQFTGPKVRYQDIYDLQYNTTPDSFLTAYQSKSWDSFKGNSFVQWLNAKKNRHTLEYFTVAKAIEKTQVTNHNDWGNYIRKVEPATLDSLKQLCYDQSKRKLPGFLKYRYAFQYLKCAYYTERRDEEQQKTEEVFNNLISNSNSITAQWSYIYYALLQKENLQQAEYLVKAFDKCDAKKYRAFSLLSAATLDTLEKTTGDHYTRVMARAIAAMKNPGRSLKDIQYLYENDPASKYLPLLITREINKLEDWLYSPEVLYFQPFLAYNLFYTDTDDRYAKFNFEYDKKYLGELLEQLRGMQQKGFAKTGFLNIAIAHLYNMLHQHQAAGQILSNMQEPAIQEEKISFTLEKLFTLINTQPVTDENTKNEIATLVKKIEELDPEVKTDDQYGYLPHREYLSSMLIYLSRKYQAAGATVIAGLLYEKAAVMTNEYIYPGRDENDFYGFIAYFEKYAQPEDMDELLRLKHRNNKTAFEKLITPRIWGKDEVYLDLQGTLYLRKADFAAALKIFEKLPENFWQETYAFAEYLPVSSVSELEKEIPVRVGNKRSYAVASKKLVIKDILDIERRLQQAKTDREKAQYTFWLANARLNISYFGKAWMVYAYGKTSTEPSADSRAPYRFAYYYIQPNQTNNVDNYYYLKDARRLYEQALQLAGNDQELRAKCLLMLGICDEYQYGFNPPENTDQTITDHYRSSYFAELNKLYSKTKFFEAVAVSCPDIRRTGAVDGQE